jgi:mRNA interferase HigB
MEVVGREVLEVFKADNPRAAGQADAFLTELEDGKWRTPHELREHFPAVSFLGEGLTVFNLKGNQFRVACRIAYRTQTVIVLKAGTHEEYDEWDL